MFSPISWTQYFKVLLPLLFVYYVVIVLVYFRKELLSMVIRGHHGKDPRFWVIRPSPSLNEPEQATANRETVATHGAEQDALFAFSNEMEAFLVQAGHKGFNRDQILSSLQLLVDKHAAVKEVPDKTELNNAIRQACTTHCSVRLSEAEIGGLWLA